MTKKKNIGFYCSSTSWGGLEMNVARYAVWMKERGWKTTVFCVKDSPLEKKAIALKIDIVLIQRNKKYMDIVNSYRVAKKFRQYAIAIAWFCDNRDMSLLGLVKKISHSRLILYYHQNMRLGVEKKDFLHTIRFKNIDAWVAPLPYLVKEVLSKTKFNADHLFQVPLGIDQHRFVSNKFSKKEALRFFNINDNQRLTIGVIGRLDKLKGQLFVLQSVVELIDQGMDIQLLLVGESTHHEGNEYEKALQSLIQERELEERVFLRPFTEKTEHFYQAVDIFVMASEGETFGMVTIEAMTSGNAIVGTDSAGTPEILDHGKYGLLYSYNNQEEFVKCIQKLYSNQKLREEYGKKAKVEALKTYSKENSCEQHEKIIYKLLASSEKK